MTSEYAYTTIKKKIVILLLITLSSGQLFNQKQKPDKQFSGGKKTIWWLFLHQFCFLSGKFTHRCEHLINLTDGLWDGGVIDRTLWAL